LRQPFIMVPFALILTLVGAAAAGQMGDATQMMEMMKMMEMMNQAKGWAAYAAPTAAPAPQWSTGSPEDIAAYLKWCEENQVRIADQTRQKQLLEQWEMKEAARKEEMKKVAAAREVAERQLAMESEWKMWEKKMTMTASFEALGYEIMEMKHKYYYLVTFEFLKFCKCSDFTADVERYFHHEGFATNKYEEFDLSDLNAPAGQDVNAIAQALFAMDKVGQTKAFFGGLQQAMCEGARTYFDTVLGWEKQYNFLERLSA